jgi:hypothetical protein
LATGIHAGFVDTDLSAWVDAPKISAADLSEQTVQALAHDRSEVLADEETRQTKTALSRQSPGRVETLVMRPGLPDRSGTGRERSAPLGKYRRSRPFVFSFAPRRQGLCGSAKQICSPVPMRSRACWAGSVPQSQAGERRSCRAAWRSGPAGADGETVFPVARHRAVFGPGRPLTDRHLWCDMADGPLA